MKTILIHSVISVSLFTATAWAEEAPGSPEDSNNNSFGYVQLTGDGIMDAYLEKTMEGVYASYEEDIANDIPPDTFTEYHHDNATSTYEHRGRYRSFTTTGIYTVKKDRLCYVYNDPGNVVGQFCFYVFKNDNCYYHYFDDDPVPETAKDFDNWTSMAYAREDRNSCLPDLS